MDWGIENIFKLIALYKQFSCLWNFKSPDYKRVDKKRNAWREISKQMEKDEETVKKKIKNLRSAYLLEKKKVQASKRSGSSADAIYEPHLYYFSEMDFLDTAIVNRKTSSNITDEVDLIEYSATVYSYESEDSLPCSSINGTPVLKQKKFSCKKPKIESSEKIDVAINALVNKINDETKENDSICLTFGRLMGIQMTKLPLSVATETMAELQKIISEKIKMYENSDILQNAIDKSNIF